MVPETELMTTDEAARYLKVCRKTLYRWLQTGRLKGYRVGRQWRLRKVDLDQWLEQNCAGGWQEGEEGDEGIPIAEEKEHSALEKVARGGRADSLDVLEEIRDQLSRAVGRTFSAEEIVAMIDRARRRATEESP